MIDNEFIREVTIKKIFNFPYFQYIEYFEDDCLFCEKIYLNGIFKIKKIKTRIKYYIFGIQIYVKIIRTMPIVQDNMMSNLTCYNLHKEVMPKYKDKYFGKDVVIIATGPTLKNYIPIKNAIHIGVNRAFQNDTVKLDYLFAVDYSGMKDYIEQAKDYPCKKFFGIYKNPEISKSWHIPDKIAIEAGAERFYSNAGFCRFKIDQDISVYPLMDIGSVIFPALHFALWTHPKRIFLVGHDCNNNGYFDANKNFRQAEFGIGKVKYGHTKLKEFLQIYYPDVKVISINPVGIKGYYQDIYTDNMGNYVDEKFNIIDINKIEGIANAKEQKYRKL